MLEKNLSIANETSLIVRGRIVNFIEFESDTEGDFVKVCTYDHHLGVAAEYIWFQKKYRNANCIKQAFSKMKLNGNIVNCDILTIMMEDGEFKNVYFDISQLMENLNNKATKKTNKGHWDNEAKQIYDILKNDMNYSVYKTDEESLFKKVNKRICIAFDISYYFGFIHNDDNEYEGKIQIHDKCVEILLKYFVSKFIVSPTFNEKMVGGYINIADVKDVNVVIEKYKQIESEVMSMIGDDSKR